MNNDYFIIRNNYCIVAQLLIIIDFLWTSALRLILSPGVRNCPNPFPSFMRTSFIYNPL